MPQRIYIDFKLYLTAATDGKGFCQVALLPTSELGETITPIIVPMSGAPDPVALALLANKDITLRNLVKLGKQLANCLLPEGPIRDLFKDACRIAGNDGGVRLRLIIADHALKQYPWEYVYFNLLEGSDSIRGFLLLNPLISMVRHEPLPHPHPIIPPSRTTITSLPMLIVTALPAGLPVLDIDREVANIQKSVKKLKTEGIDIQTQTLRDTTYDDLLTSLSGTQSVYLFHFVGHGMTELNQDRINLGAEKYEGFLSLLEDKTTRAEARVSAEEIAVLIQQAGVRIAVLGACYSGTRNARSPWDTIAGALIARDIPVVIGMQYEVYDPHAIAFSNLFYNTLAKGLALDEAMSIARLAMLGTTRGTDEVNVEWGIPVLYSRLPSGALFPEMVVQKKSSAIPYRLAIQQTIDYIGKTGDVVGLNLNRTRKGQFGMNGIRIDQKVGSVKGKLTGAAIRSVFDEGDQLINQDLGTVNGTVVGVTIDD